MSAVPRPGQTAMWPRPTSGFIGLPVRIGDVGVGRISDVLFDRGFGHVLGFVVDGRGAHRLFLPWVAAALEPDHVQAKSVFALLSTSELVFYLDNGVSLSGEVGRDMLVGRDGDTIREPAAQRMPRLAGAAADLGVGVRSDRGS